MGRARPMAPEPVLAELDKAAAQGHEKVTLLGGEPTLARGFFDILRHAQRLGFREIVVFTNGVKTARESFVDEVLAAAPNVSWRISIQGGTKAAHEATTRRPGSFDRIVESLGHLAKRRQRISVNLCVVRSNVASLPALPGLVLPYGVHQVHLDMMRPLDAGERTDDELREAMPHYSELVEPLREMVAGFPEGFDVNVGNLPYCVAPDLARVIHHDGEETFTVAVDGESTLSAPWDKYSVKRRDKLKPESCSACAFEPQCSGVFETYERFHGLSELVPVPLARLPELDVLGVELYALARALGTDARAIHDGESQLTLADGLTVALTAPGGGAAATDRISLHVVDGRGTIESLNEIWERLLELGHTPVHAPGPDAIAGATTTAIARRLARLRAVAPLRPFTWNRVRTERGGRRVVLELSHPDTPARLWLEDDANGVRGGYQLDGTPDAAAREGLRRALGVLGAVSDRRPRP